MLRSGGEDFQFVRHRDARDVNSQDCVNASFCGQRNHCATVAVFGIKDTKGTKVSTLGQFLDFKSLLFQQRHAEVGSRAAFRGVSQTGERDPIISL